MMKATRRMAALAAVLGLASTTAMAGGDVNRAHVEKFKKALAAVLAHEQYSPCNVPVTNNEDGTLGCQDPVWCISSGSFENVHQPYAFLEERSILINKSYLVDNTKLNGYETSLKDLRASDAVLSDSEIRMANQELLEESRKK